MIKSISHCNIIKNHWNWSSNIKYNNLEDFIIEIPKHGYTHCDAPSHMIKMGKSLSECEIEKLCNWASLIDVSECIGDKPITAAILEKKNKKIKKGDIIVLRSNLNELFPNTSNKYWKNSPYLDDSGSNWLVEKEAKAIVFDFPQDRAAKDLQFRIVKNNEFTEHQIILGADIMHVEHAINLNLINDDRFYFFGLPIFLPNADGGNCNPISISGLKEKNFNILDHTSLMIDNEFFKSFLKLSFEKGDQVQETGFTLRGVTHTCAIFKDSNSKNFIFKNPVINEYNIIENINSIKDNRSDVLFFNNKEELKNNYLDIILNNINFKVLCLNHCPNLNEILLLMSKVEILFVNVQNIDKLTKNSHFVFSCLNIEESLLSPCRLVSLN